MSQAFHSAKDFEEAFLGLTPSERSRLAAVARALQGSTGMTWEDLYQEAFTRGLALERRWNDRIDVTRFLIGAMESIADARRNSLEVARRVTALSSRTSSPADSGGWVTGNGVLFDVHVPVPTPEDELIKLEEDEAESSRLRCYRDQLLAIFDDDEDAQLLVIGMLDNLKGEDLRAAVGLTPVQYSSKYKKVVRRIDALQRRQS